MCNVICICVLESGQINLASEKKKHMKASNKSKHGVVVTTQVTRKDKKTGEEYQVDVHRFKPNDPSEFVGKVLTNNEGETVVVPMQKLTFEKFIELDEKVGEYLLNKYQGFLLQHDISTGMKREDKYDFEWISKEESSTSQFYLDDEAIQTSTLYSGGRTTQKSAEKAEKMAALIDEQIEMVQKLMPEPMTDEQKIAIADSIRVKFA